MLDNYECEIGLYNGDPIMTTPPFVSDTAIVIGNGESRAWYTPNCGDGITYRTWGCNAIYRDGKVDNLVAIDYSMEQEIYESGYAHKNTCWFTDWNILPGNIADTFLMGYDIPKEFIFENSKTQKENTLKEFYIASDQGEDYFRELRTNCVIQGKDPNTVQEKIDIALKMNPGLDVNDLKLKMEKDIGVWITWVDKEDNVINFDYPKGWSAGNSALHLACQNTAKEVYMLGFDLSEYNLPLNNIYKGTNNYLPASAKGFNSINWLNQMMTTFNEFADVTFYWVDSKMSTPKHYPNLEYIDKDQFCKKLDI